jgi:hypothetical protein
MTRGMPRPWLNKQTNKAGDRPFATQARSFLVEDYQLGLLDVWAGFKSTLPYSTPLSGKVHLLGL